MPRRQPKNVELQEVAKCRQRYQDDEVCTKPEFIFCFRSGRVFGLNGGGLLERWFHVWLLLVLLDFRGLNVFVFRALVAGHSYGCLAVGGHGFREMECVW